MTLTFMRPAIALAIALSLASCGGKASFAITGHISGLIYPGLVLTTNGMTLPVNPPATTFSFPNTLSYGEVYDVEVVPNSQPQHQTCTVGSYVDASGNQIIAGNKDTAGRLTSINVGVSCGLNQFTIGGSITGLKSTGLILTNGSTGGTFTAATADTTAFIFSAVPYGFSYGVTVLAQPLTETCSVSPNGTGVMGDAIVGDIVVTCVSNPTP